MCSCERASSATTSTGGWINEHRARRRAVPAHARYLPGDALLAVAGPFIPAAGFAAYRKDTKMDLEALFEGAVNDGDNESPALTDAEMVKRLRAAEAQMREPERFEPGDVMIHRWPDMADTRGADRPAVFAGYLAEPIVTRSSITDPRDFYESTAAGVIDCTVLKVVAGGRLCRFHADSRDYRMHPGFPRQRQH